ncbi:hypothetical protein C805_01181 [Eubacterium sp. 14-2]|uniref:hypothetical protein n=1 Tax=Eubacterium sp. 14-2 TaxID=1235790 RepID=UPI0003351CD0|nr:hypothetical protein [Eubacterium sp. 14-2]EOT27077.1 hypothetical protein C805_01181 [Eubacterium sp. 14-2]
MYNICRPFILHNDFLPPSREVHQDWDYLSYGYYDGISVGKNLFSEGAIDLKRLWKYSVERSTLMTGKCQEQVIFGFRSDEDERWENSFWDENVQKKYPFLFLSLLQFKNSEKTTEFCKECREFEKAMTNEEEGYRAVTYLTLDNSDLILILLSRNYLSGAELVDSLHRGAGSIAERISLFNWSLCYSFTVASLYREILNGDNGPEEEILPFVYIHAIEQSPGSVDHIYNQIKDVVGEEYLNKEKQSTLGCNDELIILKDVPWSKFRLLYQDNSGILNHSNEFYQNYLTGVTTIIGTPHEMKKVANGRFIRVSESDKGKTDSESLSSMLRKAFGKMDLINNTDCVRCHNLKKDLYQTLNVLQRFETTFFSDYVFRTLLMPLHMVKNIMEKAHTIEEKDKLFESFYDLFKGISLYAQNSVKSDRQFTQSLDYNIRIYQTPVKLNAFYNAYIYNLKEYLNSMENEQGVLHNYEFIACPGITDNMQVRELFDSLTDEEKIFIASIPENQMYDVRLMFVMLSHEVGHFVGKDIRNRKIRVKCIEKILSHVTIHYYRISLQGELPEEIPEGYWKGLEKELKTRLKEKMEQQKSSDYIRKRYVDISEEEIKKLEKDLEKYGVYSSILNLLLQESMKEILEESEELFSYLLEDTFMVTMKKADLKNAERERKKLRRKIQKITNEWLTDSPWNKTMTNLSASMDLLIENFKECVADVIGILTLRLSMFDYLDSVIQSNSDQGRIDIVNTKALVRCALVVYCMENPGDDLRYYWSDKEIQVIDESGNGRVRDFKNAICEFLDEYFKGKESPKKLPEIAAYKKSAVNILYDSSVLQQLGGYLSVCRRTFEERNSKEIRSQQKELINVYKLQQENNIETFILGVQKYIFDYQNVVTEKMGELVGEN